MTHPLSIAITADPGLPVPPRLYGGIERIIHLLVEGLVRRGHHVVLFAHPDSAVSCELVPYPGQTWTAVDSARNAATIAGRVLGRHFDLIHSFGRLACLMPLAGSSIPKIMSYQRPITPRSIRLASRLFGRSIQFTACSRQMIAPVESIGRWHVVYNAVSMDTYRFCSQVDADAPLVFLGRLEAEKGAHLAIEAAARAGRRLVLAGNVVAAKQTYFDTEIKPHIDGTRVEYVGPLNDAEKDKLLGQAAALLMPILWDEPFGIVMAEALACGTPVVGFARGSVPEVVTDGVTGFVAEDMSGLVAGISRLGEIDRRACRTAAETRFSDDVIVRDYEALYVAAAPMARRHETAASDALY